MLIEALVPRVRTALGVSASYDTETIPDLIRSAIGRLLRDYNFPKSRARATFALAMLDQNTFQLPVGFKRAFGVRFYDPADKTWSDPLRRYEGFTLPHSSGETRGWWIEGQQLFIDTPIAQDGLGKELVLFYQDQSVANNSDWLLDNFEDAVAYLAITRGAADMRKPEVMQTYAPLWSDEQTSLAIYLNELEWDGVVVMQRETREPRRPRYGC
jgi:hypothetical protein